MPGKTPSPRAAVGNANVGGDSHFGGREPGKATDLPPVPARPIRPVFDAVAAFQLTLIEALPDPSDWAHEFFNAYLSIKGRGVLGPSLEAANVSRQTYKTRMTEDALFGALQLEANQIWIETVEYELHVRVTDGTLKPIVSRGQIIDWVREIDNHLLMWYLERLAPEKYHIRERLDAIGADAPTKIKFRMAEEQTALPPGK